MVVSMTAMTAVTAMTAPCILVFLYSRDANTIVVSMFSMYKQHIIDIHVPTPLPKVYLKKLATYNPEVG